MAENDGPMALRCDHCGMENPSRFRFCGECGAALAAAADGAAASVAGEGERRQITVLFCDLVGSTALSHRLDPEDWREVIRAYQRTCAGVVESFGGHVARYVGDALKVYFGYPLAREDDAARALRAGLALVEAMPALTRQLAVVDEPLRVRVGIHTGLVVTGDVAGHGYERNAAVGETPNIAARLQSLAEPDAVMVSDVTRRLVPGLFELEDCGEHSLKGIGEPMRVHRVRRECADPGQGDALAGASLSPLTGREAEMGLLRRCWEESSRGSGRVVVLSGEAGIGKSRLVRALRAEVEQAGHRWLVCRCFPHTQSSALFPVIQLLQHELGFGGDDDEQARLEKLRLGLASAGRTGPDSLATFASLLSLPGRHADGAPDRSPEARKRDTMQELLAWLVALAGQGPLVVVADDLHWADPSSIEFLSLVARSAADLPLLMLLTRRPGTPLALPEGTPVALVDLPRLSPADVRRLANSLTRGRPLPDEVLEQVIRRTDGVPLFVEELVKMVLESGLVAEKGDGYELAGPLPPLAIPATLRDSLMARLDRLSTVKEVAQLAAVIGREFSFELLCAVFRRDEGELRRALERLAAAELVHQRVPAARATWVFKHALIQEAAYQSLLKSRRQSIHRQVAEALADRFPEVRRTQPELVAHHYSAAGIGEKAVEYWLLAGQRASRRSAYREAIVHLRRGIDALASIPEGSDRMRWELQLQVALGEPLVASEGYGAPSVGAAYGRARELCQHLGEEPQLGLVLGGVWLYYTIRAEYRTAQELADQLLRLSERMPVPMMIAGAHTAIGATRLNVGDLRAAREHLEQAAGHGERDQLVFSSDLRVSALCFLANALAALGEVEEATRRIEEALARARDLDKPFFVANALTQCAWIHQLARDVDRAAEAADAAVALADEQGFPYWKAFGLMTQGWVLVEKGDVGAGLSRLARSLEVARESGTERGASFRLATLAEGCLKAGRPDDALATLKSAQAHVERTGERFCAAELFRLRGEALLQKDGDAARARAEESFREATRLARAQGGRLWELRAALSLAKLGGTSNGDGRAHEELARACDGFPDQVRLRDLDEARGLLRSAQQASAPR